MTTPKISSQFHQNRLNQKRKENWLGGCFSLLYVHIEIYMFPSNPNQKGDQPNLQSKCLQQQQQKLHKELIINLITKPNHIFCLRSGERGAASTPLRWPALSICAVLENGSVCPMIYCVVCLCLHTRPGYVCRAVRTPPATQFFEVHWHETQFLDRISKIISMTCKSLVLPPLDVSVYRSNGWK